MVAYDVVVLDRDLPGVHGDTVCRMIAEGEQPAMVLMLTAAAAPGERVAGLGSARTTTSPSRSTFPNWCCGACARSSQAGRPRARSTGRRCRARSARADRDPRRPATRPLGQRVRGPRSADAGQPAVLSAEDLLEQVWDENADPFTKTVQVTIGRLRRKLGEPDVDRDLPGVGYRIAPDGSD